MSFGQMLWQLSLLAVLAYLAGSLRVRPNRPIVRTILAACKGAAAVGILYVFLTGNQGIQIPLFSLGFVSMGLGIWMMLLGEAWPIMRAFNKNADMGVMVGTVLGASITVIIVTPITQAIVLITSFVLTYLLLIKTKQRASYVLPMIALIPLCIGYVGTLDQARAAAYVLLAVSLILEITRFVRPSFNRRLARLAPEIFGEREIVRPLGVSGAILVVTLLVHTEQIAALIIAAGFGIAAVSLAKALQTKWPYRKDQSRSAGRGLALYLAIALAFLLPSIALLTGIHFGILILVALGTWTAALVPLPVDRYLVTPLVAAILLFLIV